MKQELIGGAAIWATGFFEKVITIEASEEIFNGNDFNKYNNLDACLGESVAILPEKICDDSIIYLDAHFSGGNTFNDFPLIQELKIINSIILNNATIIIDDARYCMACWNDDSYGSLPEIISLISNDKSRYVVIIDDMIIAAPLNYKELVDKYTNIISKKYCIQFASDTTVKERKHTFMYRMRRKLYSVYKKLIT